MDGFKVIPISNSSPMQSVQNSGNFSVPVNNSATGLDVGIEILDEDKEKVKAAAAAGVSWTFVLSIVALLGALGYFGFLVFYRLTMISQIQTYTDEMVALGKNIDVKEMQDFQAMDLTLNTINGKLSNHVLTSEVFDLVNQNIRTNLEITDYSLDVKDKEVDVTLMAVAPSFKELAEQTEKLFDLREANVIKNFSVSNLSFEAETRRLHFNINIVFDKSKVTASAQNIPQTEQQAPVNNAATTTTN